MPRAKSSAGWVGAWLVEPLALKKDEPTRKIAQALIRAARIEDASTPQRIELINAVRDALGLYSGAVEQLDEAPRPANQLAALREMQPHIEALRDALVNLDSLTRDMLQMPSPRRGPRPATRHVWILRGWLDGQMSDAPPREPVSLVEVHKQLTELDRAIYLAELQLERQESRGGRSREALRLVLAHLAQVFQSSEQGKKSTRADYQIRLTTFIVNACKLLPSMRLPRRDRVLDLLPPSLKVQRKTP